MCVPEANLGRPLREAFLIELRGARAECRRRHGDPGAYRPRFIVQEAAHRNVDAGSTGLQFGRFGVGERVPASLVASQSSHQGGAIGAPEARARVPARTYGIISVASQRNVVKSGFDLSRIQ
jgi:hypothetical protein